MTRPWVAAVAALVLTGGIAWAATPPQRCQRGKNDAAGKYALCRQKAEGKFALNGDDAARTATLQRCLGKYEKLWARLETQVAKKGAVCPSIDDSVAIQGAIDANTTNVASALAGGTLSDCSGALSSCQGDLTTCTGTLGTCSGNLTTCTGDLTTCNTSFGTAQTDLTTCTGNLATCTTDLGTTQASLTTCTGDLTTTQASLTTCTGDLTSCNGSLTTCSGNLTTAQASLTTCTADLSTCQATPKAQRLKTGQTTCSDAAGSTIPCAGTGQDGELQTGLARSYVDNGDGTITDGKTGLMWEKLSDDGSIHDWNDLYTWANAVSVKLAALNGGGGFAGHADWRLPNLNELQSLADYAVTPAPVVPSAFNNGCAPACTVLTCSCTQTSGLYWTSSSYQVVSPFTQGWWVDFNDGSIGPVTKAFSNNVRAVRTAP